MKKTYRILTTFKKSLAVTVLTLMSTVASYGAWDGNTPSTLSDAGITGTGQSSDPYVISTEAGLAYFGKVMNGDSHYWKIAPQTTFDMGNMEWKFGRTQDGLTYFSGSLVGQGAVIKNFKLNADGFTYVGFFNGISGTVEGITLDHVTFTDGNKWNSISYGILASAINGGTVRQCIVQNSTMTFTNLSGEWNSIYGIGGMVGLMSGTDGKIDDSKVVGVTITCTEKTINPTEVYVGGMVGRVASVASLSRCGAQNVTINLPLKRFQRNPALCHMSAGGVVGNIVQPCANMPTDLCAHNCKIYCPEGSVGPVCGMFLKSGGTSPQTVSDDYSAENGTVSADNINKTSTWMYNGYQLGLNKAVRSETAYQKQIPTDADTDGVTYLEVGDAAVTFPVQNSVGNNSRSSRTVIWYTQNNGRRTLTATAQSVYPQYRNQYSDNNPYPDYYYYFMQGYNVGTYVTNEQAEAFIGTLAKATVQSVIKLTDENLGQRGLGTHTIKVEVSKGSEENITWNFYVNGEKMGAESATSIEVAPNYSSVTTVLVQASDGAMATLNLPKAYLATLHCPHPTPVTYKGKEYGNSQYAGTTIESDNKSRGTEDNPYVISTEEELRLWSSLSRMTGTIDNGPAYDLNHEIVGINEDGANHFNTSYFVLGADIDFDPNGWSTHPDTLATRIDYVYQNGSTTPTHTYTGAAYRIRHKFDPAYHFDPICGFTSEEIYNQEHTFRGVFDGDGKIIKNLRQIWRGGMLNMTYGERATMNYGLFGCIGGDANKKAVVKNVIIENAIFEHDVYNGSFAYLASYASTNHTPNDSRGTSVAVGALAGMVTNNSDIYNIDVKNSCIVSAFLDHSAERNDYSCLDIHNKQYAFHLWVGGVVGRVQAAYNNQRGDLAGSIKLHYLSTDIDIDMPGVSVNNGVNDQINTDKFSGPAKRFYFNAGGIVGSMYSNAAYSSLPWPEHVFFTGQLRGMAMMGGPVFGYVNYGNMTENITTSDQAHQHWIGYPGIIKTGYYNNYWIRLAKGDETYDGSKHTNPSANGSYIKDHGAYRSHATAGLLWAYRSSGHQSATHGYTINGGLYGETGNTGRIMYYGPITPESPSDPLYTCTHASYADTGARSVLKHGNGDEGALDTNHDINGYFIGINQGVWKDWTVAANQEAVRDEFTANGEKRWMWEDINEFGRSGRPILTSTSVEHLEAELDDMENPTKIIATLHGIETGLEEYTYTWYNTCNSTPVQEAKNAANGGTVYQYTQSEHDQYFYVTAYNGFKTFKSDVVRVPGTLSSEGFNITIEDTQTSTSAIAYTSWQNYMESTNPDVRITQEEYYALPVEKKTKTPADYYPCEDPGDCINKWVYDYEAALTNIGFNVETQQIEITHDEWNTAYTDKPIHEEGGHYLMYINSKGEEKYTDIKNWATIYDQYKKHFNFELDSNNDTIWTSATPKDDLARKMLVRIPTVVYSYTEFMELDKRTGSFDASAAPDYGYTYTFDDGDPAHASYAGTSWKNKGISDPAYAALPAASKTVPAKNTHTLKAVISPKTAQELEQIGGYTIEYQWYRRSDDSPVVGATSDTYIVTNEQTSDRGDYECRVVITDTYLPCASHVFYRQDPTISWGKDYIYISPTDGFTMDYYEHGSNVKKTTGVGDDLNDGKTPQTPVKTWPRAYQLLSEDATWDQNYVVLIGTSSVDATKEGFGYGTQGFNGNSTTGNYSVWYNRASEKYMNRNATITSQTDKVDSFGGILTMANAAGNGTQFALFGDTRIEHLTLTHESPDGGYGIIACQYYNLEMGDGLLMENYPSASSASAEVGPLPGTYIADLQIFGGCNNDNRFLQMPGSVTNYENEAYIPHPEGFTITVKSGFYSNICASGRQSTSSDLNGIVGTPNRPLKCNIVVDINRQSNEKKVQYGNTGSKVASYDIGAVMAGNHEGAQYGDVNIIIRSGIIGRVTSGSLGNKRLAGNFGTTGGFRAYKTYYGTNDDVYFPYDTYFGRCNILIDPASSKENKQEPDINKRVVISEIYGGALGRHMTDASSAGVCMSTFYGKSNITINGGTFDINCPDDYLLGEDQHEQAGKYGLRAYRNQYQDSNGRRYYRAQPGIYGGGAGGFSGIGTDKLHTNDLRLPYWDDAITTYDKNKVVYDPAVFGQKVVRYAPYSVYKDKTGDAKVYITCIDSIVGTQKYETKIDPAETSTTITINGGNFFPRFLPQGAGIYGAGNGYVNNQLIDFPNKAPNPLGGSLLGAEGKTAVEININGGTFNCNVYGGGRGNDMYYYRQVAYDGTQSWVGESRYAKEKYALTNMDDPDFWSFATTQENYARNAQITGNVVMNINGGLFKGSIYGSGAGTSNMTDNQGKQAGEGCANMARIWGNTTINITSDSSLVYVFGNVYGGGENARVLQNTDVHVSKGVIYGSVFGGGDNATVGEIGLQDVYAASSYWRIQDDENYANYQANKTPEEFEVYLEGLIHTGEVTSDGRSYNIGDLKPNQTPTGTKEVGLGRTSVYTSSKETKIYGDVYGGGNAADVNGDTYVGMTAGYVGGSIFGGGNGIYVGANNNGNKPANVHGFTDVFLNGYTVMWDKMCDYDAFSPLSDYAFSRPSYVGYGINNTTKTEFQNDAYKYNSRAAIADAAEFENRYIKSWSTAKNYFIMESTYDNGKTKSIWLDAHGGNRNAAGVALGTNEGRNAHNVFGGGNTYCSVDSTARVTVTRGMAPKALLETNEWEQSYYDNDNPHFYVFGGGYGAETRVQNTYVNVGMEDKLTEDATTEEVLAKGGSMALFDEDGNAISGSANSGGENESIGIFNNGHGIADYTVVGVLGGGMEGQINENTEVIIGGNTFIHRVYGGGYGKRDRSAYTEVTDLGRVKGHTHVTANGGLINGDIFGGGARGDVDSTTFVEVLRDCKVFGSVYGGGDVASVGDAQYDKSVVTDTVSSVLLGGGIVYHHAFAGGSQGPIYGSTLINVVDSILNGQDITPYVYGDIYGGGEKAFVDGNTNVLLEGGFLARDIYGGGLGVLDANGGTTGEAASADVHGDANVTVNGGSMLWKQQCDDYANGQVYYFDNTKLIETSRYGKGLLTADDITGTEGFFNWQTMHLVVNHNVYGGGNAYCTVTGNTNVVMNHGLVTEGLQFYDEPMISPFAMMWYELIKNRSYPQFAVLGGGYGKHTLIRGNANVSMNVSNYAQPMKPGDGASTEEIAAYEAAVAAHNQYKKYKAYDEDYGNFALFESELKSRWNTMDPDLKDLNYGGTNMNVYRRYRISRYAWSGGVHGHVMANVYGGSWAGKVAGNTTVTMDGTSGCRNVFGGGVGMATATANEDKLGEVGGTATVIVNGSIISGNVYGGGAGVESTKNADGTPTMDYYDVARVFKTDVTVNGRVIGDEDGNEYNGNNGMPIDGTVIFGSVNGGGDVANVGAYQADYDNPAVAAEDAEPVTSLVFNGGNVMSQVYAGGSGRDSTSCVNYTHLGAVYGNTKLVINPVPGDENDTHIFNNVYGGGMCGTVFGHTDVDINGGNFGHDIFGGGYGIVDTVYTESGAVDKIVLTDAAVKGNTRINIDGGDWLLSQIWLMADENGKDIRAWKPANIFEGQQYSSQYDAYNKRFTINHNAYGGGNNCSTIDGDAYITMTKGLLDKAAHIGRKDAVGNLFEEREWIESYNKVGSAHFSVFGAGYGENTLVKGDTHVDIVIEGEEVPTAAMENDKVPYYERFKNRQSLLDVVGGGYNGEVGGKTNVHIGGNTFMRRVFTGGYYAPVNETNLLVTSGDIDEVFGGGLLGDVYDKTNVQIGWRASVNFDGKTYSTNDNAKLFINKNVYGGNDVSGSIGYKDETHTAGQGTYLHMYGGNLYGDVYGGGNGNYLYALAQKKISRVMPNEHYLKTDLFEGYDLVYTVPMRDGMISSKFASPAQKVVNISTFRPSTIEANIELYGLSNEDRLKIKGNVFGGGNCATVDGVVDEQGNNSAKVNFYIKDNIDVGGIYLGSDGDDLFADSEENPFLSNFQTINGINLEDSVIWDNDPANHGIALKYLPVDNDDRPIVYPHLLDLYFQPVEMSIQPKVLWGVDPSEDGDVQNAKIGIFCCGGNRGNMNVYPAETGANKGNVVDIKFPEHLVITNRIIGGCNNANYIWHNSATGNVTKHVGGYLLGKRKSENPMIRLLVRNQFEPSTKEVTSDGDTHTEYVGGNVYGGCYKSGTINGDVTVDLRSNMLKGLRQDWFPNITEIGEPACNVYGAGYGTNSYVYGDTKVIVGAETNCKTHLVGVNESPAKGLGFGSLESANASSYYQFDDTGTSANYIFGGGLQGNVVGNATVRYLNGHTLHSITGGSYAGYLWGSTQVLVGYPEYYKVKRQGTYTLKRKDERTDNLAMETEDINGVKTKAIKQEVKLMAGDIIAPTLYEAIIDAPGNENLAVEHSSTTAFELVNTDKTPTVGWENVAITIDEAIYGGGYSLASGSSVMANNTLVLKYDEQYNTDTNETMVTSVDYGGNTTMVVWDKMQYDGNGYTVQPDEDTDVDHISISQQEMMPVDLPDGTDLFGYYYKDKNGHYHYIYEENKYFQGKQYPQPPLYDGTFVSAYNFDAEGGMYGDGHLSFSAGFRTGEIKGYGFNGGKTIEGARLMNTFQRMDMLRVEDCNVIMLGARDYATNATNTTPYSMSRIGELQLISHIDDTGDLQKVSDITTDNIVSGVKGARNFLGLSNNILYVGCIYTNTPFGDDEGKWHDYQNNLGDGKSYKQKKQEYIDGYYDEDSPNKGNAGVFEARNDGTAKNLIGISSGYALKIQNVLTKAVGKTITHDGEETTTTTVLNDTVFYGPIVGVAEINLMSARLDEGGGYIYADNVHDRPLVNGTEPVDFLVTTGNFVFPHNESGRYILDDCYVKNYDETLGATPATEPEEAHYWYIEGYNYFYNVHITGYTSDSRGSKALLFDSDNTDLLTIMKGAKKGQKVKLHSIRWRSEHIGKDDKSYNECDIDGSYYTIGSDGKVTTNIGTYPVTMTKAASEYGVVPTGQDADTLGLRWNDSYYKLRVSAKADTALYYREDPMIVDGESVTPAHGDLSRANMTTGHELTGELLTDEPVIALQLVDAVDNTTEAYYKRHLSETCKATIVLTVPAMDENGTQVQGYTTINALFTEPSYTLATKVGKKETVDLTNNTQYYYFNDNTHEYMELDTRTLRYHVGTGRNDSDFRPIKSLSTNEDGLFNVVYEDLSGHDVAANAVTSIFTYGPRSYCYTLYLTIDYVQGPEVRGHININNCALPGEMVRLTTEGVKISADESMAPIGYYWRVGMREKNAEGKWEFADKTKWVPATATVEDAPAGYDSYRVNSDVHNGVFKGVIFDEDDNYLQLPVYYFMNGYGVQYGIEFNGLEGKIFPVSMAESDTLLVHNFHRMSTHSTNQNLYLHLDEAAARAKASEEYKVAKAAWDEQKEEAGYTDMADDAKAAWLEANPEPTYVAPLNRPRVYMQDEEDLNAFYQFVDSIGRYDEGTHLKKAQIGTKKYVVPTGGGYMQFYMQDNIAFNKEYYHTPLYDFEGDFDGLGHTVDLSNTNRVQDGNAPTFLKDLSGNVFNLGVIGKPLAQTVADDDKPHVFNTFVYGMKNKVAVPVISGNVTAGNTALDNCYDLTVADEYDFNYGRVAYNLNKYYLAERYRRGKGAGVVAGHIEQYYGSEDYQYAHRGDAFTGRTTGVTYLRTGGNDLPNYSGDESRHDKHHTIDKARATVAYYETQAEVDALNTKYNEEYAYEIDAANSGSPVTLTADPYEIGQVKSVTYRPLFNEAYVVEEVGKMAVDTLRNDYIMFGQNLTETPDALPKNIASCINEKATNRVWRASGFYGSKKDEGFYYNALTTMTTMVNDPRLTAVDLTCQRDGVITANSYQNDEASVLTSVEGAANDLQSVFFAPTGDTPADDLYWKFAVAMPKADGTHVTQNLLVYAAKETNANTKVKDGIDYEASDPTTEIKGHRVVLAGSTNNAELLHLVDKENFNAPIAFTAARAWYDRDPKMETGYVDVAGQGWESVALPFAVKTATLSEPIERYYDYPDEVESDGENKRNTKRSNDVDDETKKGDQTVITFFYGEGENSEDNPNIINHEYWLRSMTGVGNNSESKLSGQFKRPLLGGEEGFEAYKPFVVSFPGKKFYEFDMTGRSVTFSNENTDVAVTDDAVEQKKAGEFTSGTRKFTHYAAFMNENNANVYAIALKENADDEYNKGEVFVKGAHVYPFRAKIVSEASAGAKAASFADIQQDEPEVIYISALGISLEDKGIEEPETEDVIESDGLRIYPSGKRIVVESTYATTIKVYGAGGQLVRVLDVRPGTSIYSGFASGVYVVEQKKMLLK